VWCARVRGRECECVRGMCKCMKACQGSKMSECACMR
jgi:hypothetical protein